MAALLDRRTLIAAAAGSALPLLGGRVFAADPMKVEGC